MDDVARTLQAIIDADDEQVFALDTDLCYLAFNRAHADILRARYGVEVQCGTASPIHLLGDTATVRARLAFDRALAGDVTVTEYTLETGGEVRLLESSCSPVCDESGAVVGAVFHTRDRTRRRRNEQALRDSEERLRAMFTSAPLGIALIDSLTGGIYEVNARFAEIAGRTVEEMRTIDWMSITHPDDVQMDLDQMARLNADEIPGFQMDKRYLRPDGSVVWISMTIAPLVEEDGTHTRHLCMVDDITERKALEARISERNTLLEATNRELEAFVYSASHDLRTPLRAIDGFSEMVIEDADERLSDDDREHLQRVRAAAQRMARLIDHLVALSRADRKALQREPADFSAVAAVVVEELRDAQPGRDVRVDIEQGIEVDADPELLRVIVANLIGNAWKFTGKQQTAHIEVGRTPARDDPALFVRDDGVGLDVEEADHLFGAFQRYHAPEDFPGDGIGLATVQRLVARHGGRVWAESALGRGATFCFTLPPAP